MGDFRELLSDSELVPKSDTDIESIQRSDCGVNLGRKSRKYGPKKEESTMLLTEGGCVVM